MNTPEEYGAVVQRVLADAWERLDAKAVEAGYLQPGQRLSLRDEVALYVWPQVWGDTSCGFGGMAGQMITSAPTFVCHSYIADAAVVYHGGRLAYLVTHPSEHFWQGVMNQQLPGPRDSGRHQLSRPQETPA